MHPVQKTFNRLRAKVATINNMGSQPGRLFLFLGLISLASQQYMNHMNQKVLSAFCYQY